LEQHLEKIVFRPYANLETFLFCTTSKCKIVCFVIKLYLFCISFNIKTTVKTGIAAFVEIEGKIVMIFFVCSV